MDLDATDVMRGLLAPGRIQLSHGLNIWVSLPEFMNLKLFGKTILVVNIVFFFGGPSTQQVRGSWR